MCHERATCDFILEARTPFPSDDAQVALALEESSLHSAWANAHRGEALGPLGFSSHGMCQAHADAELAHYANHPRLIASIVPFNDEKARWPYGCGYDDDHFMEQLEERERVHALAALAHASQRVQPASKNNGSADAGRADTSSTEV